MWITRLLSLSIISGSIYCQTDVRLPPTITQNPIAHFKYRSDESVMLQCKAFGIPSVDYEWKKNEGILNLNQNNIKRLSDGSGSITINPITLLDEGYYHCIAKNQYGTALSNTSFLQMAVHSPNQQTGINRLTVIQGEAFHIQNQPVKSVPPATFEWESAIDPVDKSPTALVLTNRIQVADNGDLYFAYAVKEDDLRGRLYKCAAFNEYLDLRSGGSYANVTVTRAVGGLKKFAPTIAFPSITMTTAVEGKDATLRCFFSGNPEPSISWTGPRNTLPDGRFRYSDYNSKLQLFDLKPSDQGDYICTGTNDQGSTRYTQQIKVEAKPKFLSFSDRPHDTNVTEGNSISFTCKAHAIPEAIVVWYRNGKPIDGNAPPKRYSFSNDKKTLTIQNLCRNCVDRPESVQSDLGIIQCNASNVHGYDFGAGYVNVLTKTHVMIIADDKNVEVEMNEDRRVVFDCQATSDPLTPVVPEWWYLPADSSSKGALLVYDAPPIVTLTGGQLVIHVIPVNNSREWVKHQGTYNCTASNNYSSHSELATITIKNYEPIDPVDVFVTYWWIILLILLILLLILLTICCCCYLRRNRGDKYEATTKEMMHVTPLYETVPCDGYETISCDVLSTNKNPSHVDQGRQMTETARRSNALESMYLTITDNTDDLAYDDCLATAEGENPNSLPSTTAQHDETIEEESDYTGLTDRENAYLTVYTSLQQTAELGKQENTLSNDRI